MEITSCVVILDVGTLDEKSGPDVSTVNVDDFSPVVVAPKVDVRLRVDAVVVLVSLISSQCGPEYCSVLEL